MCASEPSPPPTPQPGGYTRNCGFRPCPGPQPTSGLCVHKCTIVNLLPPRLAEKQFRPSLHFTQGETEAQGEDLICATSPSRNMTGTTMAPTASKGFKLISGIYYLLQVGPEWPKAGTDSDLGGSLHRDPGSASGERPRKDGRLL